MAKSIKEKREDRSHQWQPVAEAAPSTVKADEPSTARVFGMIGASLILFGGMTLVLEKVFGLTVNIDTGLSNLIMAVGVVGLLAHAVFDSDLQVRRLYWGVGALLIVAGAALCAIPFKGTALSTFEIGYPGLGLGLLFLLASLRHETDLEFRRLTLWGIGIAGLVMTLLFLILGNNFAGGEFLVPYGAMLAVMGLIYLTRFASQLGVSTDGGYYASLAIGGLGLVALLIGALRSLLPHPYLVPWGLTFMGCGALYILVSAFLWSDSRIVVMTRRELATFFYSPMAYLIIIGLTVVGWILFLQFLDRVTNPGPQDEPVFEPIVQSFILGWPLIICVIFIVPVLTMRLMSEEWRSGTLEVTLTAPVGETAVVVSKFLASLILFLLVWIPYPLFLIALRVLGGEAFDYRPIFSFFLAMTCTGAGFLAMGLFFSSLTRNQIIAAVLTFAGMLAFTLLFLIKRGMEFAMAIQRERHLPVEEPAWFGVLAHINYVDVWIDSLRGVLSPRMLLFHLTFTVFWLFLTVKVLESRKWR